MSEFTVGQRVVANGLMDEIFFVEAFGTVRKLYGNGLIGVELDEPFYDRVGRPHGHPLGSGVNRYETPNGWDMRPDLLRSLTGGDRRPSSIGEFFRRLREEAAHA